MDRNKGYTNRAWPISQFLKDCQNHTFNFVWKLFLIIDYQLKTLSAEMTFLLVIKNDIQAVWFVQVIFATQK